MAGINVENANQDIACYWQECTEKFADEESFYNHVHKHLAEYKIECSGMQMHECCWAGCTKAFKAHYNLKVHIRKHTGEHPFSCTFPGCNKKFSRPENLHSHINIHYDAKPYSCRIAPCTLSFKNTSDRSKHEESKHSGAKIVCRIVGCNLSYNEASSLRKHILHKHGEKAYLLQCQLKALEAMRGTGHLYVYVPKKKKDKSKVKVVKVDDNFEVNVPKDDNDSDVKEVNRPLVVTFEKALELGRYHNIKNIVELMEHKLMEIEDNLLILEIFKKFKRFLIKKRRAESDATELNANNAPAPKRTFVLPTWLDDGTVVFQEEVVEEQPNAVQEDYFDIGTKDAEDPRAIDLREIYGPLIDDPLYLRSTTETDSSTVGEMGMWFVRN